MELGQYRKLNPSTARSPARPGRRSRHAAVRHLALSPTSPDHNRTRHDRFRPYTRFRFHAHVVPREGRPADAEAPPLSNRLEIELVEPSPGPSSTSPGPEIQIVFMILRPSTISEIPNGGFGGIVFCDLPALWLLCAAAPALSCVIGTWVIGACIVGVCAWERDPAFAWAWASAYCC
jgi:hypothetical protein